MISHILKTRYPVEEGYSNTLLFNSEAAIEGVQASVDAFKLLSGGWCLKIEIVIVFGNI